MKTAYNYAAAVASACIAQVILWLARHSTRAQALIKELDRAPIQR